jgi:queuine/archaeosine tRNA-ribosyltransferase
MACTHATEECVTYAVTSRNNRSGVASGDLCGVRDALVAMQMSGKHLCSSESTLNNRGSCVFCGSTSRLYNQNLRQLELELSRAPELAVAAEN